MIGRAMAVLGVAALALVPAAALAAPQKIIFDTDIGDDIDDAYALALIASRPDVKLLGVTTAHGETGKRAEIAAKLLSVMGRKDVPVCAGRSGEGKLGRQYEWAKGFRSKAMLKTSAVAFMKREIERAPGEVTIVPVGALTNVGDLVTRFPDVRSRIRRIVLMGGAARVGYNNQPPVVPEWNIRCDPAAARAVFESGIPIVMAGLDATTMMQLDPERQKKLFAHGTRTTDAVAALMNLWGTPVPTLFDPVAVAWALGNEFAEAEQLRIVVEADGTTRVAEGPPNATVLVRPRKEEFLDWYVEALKSTR